MEDLKDKVVLISGTAGGQGRAAALAFARAGAKVFGCDVKVAEAEETVRMVTAAGGTMKSIQPLDLSDFDNAKAWATSAHDTWGGIDVLYNNAGSLRARAPFGNSTVEEWELTLKYELTMPYVTTLAVWPFLVARGGGLILNTASISGHLEFLPMRSAAHGATKAGVMGLTRTLAAEGAPHNIRAISISPGLIKSPATARFWTGEDERQTAIGEGLTANIPMGRHGECEEVASVAVFLASSGASYINGTDILVDGGVRSCTFTPISGN